MDQSEERARSNQRSWLCQLRGTFDEPNNRGQSRRFRSPRLASMVLLVSLALTGCQSGDELAGVYVVSADGGTPRKIGETGGAPVWSPDGSKLAWGNEDGLTIWSSGNDSIADLTQGAIAGLPAWSPDGRSLAFVNQDDGVLEAIDAQTGERQVEIAIGQRGERPQYVHIGGPSWSPDGASIAYICWDGAGDEVCTISADAGEVRQLTMLEPWSDQESRAASNTGPPAWSPNGEMIAVAAYPEKRGAPAGIFIVDLERGNARRIAQLQPNSAIAWTRDNRAVLFSARSQNRSDVFEVSVRGGAATNQTSVLESGSRSPTFSPDSKRFAVATGDTIAVVEHGEERGIFRVPGLVAADPAWSPTGNEIAFVARPNPIRSFD